VTSVLIIDDHPIVLQGCRRILEDVHVETIFEARDAVSGYRTFCRQKPDVVVIDLAMEGKGLGGLALIRRIKTQDARARILVFSMHSDPTIVARALEAGASGYVIKDTSSEEFVDAFEKVRAGKAHLSNELALQVALVGTGGTGDPLRSLTPREMDVLSLLAQGKPYSGIAETLNVSYKTVVNLCSQLRQKLGAKNLPELIKTAVQLLSPQS
jgi:DNA-binding NarL/FixJ family response regulator